MNRKGFARETILSFGWEGISEHYRDKSGCIIYLSSDKSNIYIDVPNDVGSLSSDDSKESGIAYYGKTPLTYMVADYLRITKVMLRNNKRARRWFNSKVKNNFYYAGRLFKEYFLPDGRVNWSLIIQVDGDSDHVYCILFGEGIDWKGYDPVRGCDEFQKNRTD